MENASRPSADDVISKLKDEGDFDTLRLQIIRKLKDNEDLRNHIMSEIKQSATAKREGIEKLKPRQLSDAIHQELGNKIMDQISDELWKIIRSEEGMRAQIRETVESVYNRLLNPQPKEEKHASATIDPSASAVKDSAQHAQSTEASACQPTSPIELDPDVPPGFAPSEPDVPPGFAPPTDHSLISNTQLNTHGSQDGHAPLYKEVKEAQPQDSIDAHPSSGSGVHPPCSSEPVGIGSDDEPDIPPGFG